MMRGVDYYFFLLFVAVSLFQTKWIQCWVWIRAGRTVTCFNVILLLWMTFITALGIILDVGKAEHTANLSEDSDEEETISLLASSGPTSSTPKLWSFASSPSSSSAPATPPSHQRHNSLHHQFFQTQTRAQGQGRGRVVQETRTAR